MVRLAKLYKRIINNQKNVKFADFITIVESFGFKLDRSKGSHRIYKHPEISQAFLTLQSSNNQAKPYQIKQFLRLVEEYNLKMVDDEEDVVEESNDTAEEDDNE